MALTEVNSLGIKDLEVKTADIAAANVTLAKVENVTDGQIIVGNGSNRPTAVAVSGDVTLANTGAVTIANGAVEHAMLADDSVDGDNIADNSVGLAAMAHGTDGNLITYNASGEPAHVATGNDGQVLTSQGAGQPPQFETISTTDTKSFRNLIINGDCKIGQKINTDTIAANTTCADMFVIDCTTGGGNPSGFTMNISNGGPVGFTKNQKVIAGSSTWTPASGNIAYMQHNIEAGTAARCSFGNSNALAVTLSFYVLSNVTGEYSVALTNNTSARVHDNASRNYISSYTISSADTWERKTITFPGDTSGTWATTGVGAGMCPVWDLGSGTDHEASTGSWQNGADFRKASTVKMGDTANSYWHITGIQLEVGSSATDYEHRTPADEMRNVRRYYCTYVGQDGNGNNEPFLVGHHASSSQFIAELVYPVAMRTTPSIDAATGTNYWYVGSTNTGNITGNFTIHTNNNSQTMCWVAQALSGSTAGQGATIMGNNTNAYFALSAEM